MVRKIRKDKTNKDKKMRILIVAEESVAQHFIRIKNLNENECEGM